MAAYSANRLAELDKYVKDDFTLTLSSYFPFITWLCEGSSVGEDLRNPFSNFQGMEVDPASIILLQRLCPTTFTYEDLGWNGREEQDVTVKMWAPRVYMSREHRDIQTIAMNDRRFREEVMFLTGEARECCPFVGKLMGFCSDRMGVVYDLNSLDTLRNLVTGEKGTLKWVDRIRILYQLALLLECLHAQKPECVVRNISAAHIMIDQNLKPVLVEFGLLYQGQIEVHHRDNPWGAFGYIDPSVLLLGLKCWRVDVFAFAVIMLELLCKCTFDFAFHGSKGLLHCSADELYEMEKSESFFSLRFGSDPTVDAQDTLSLLELVTKCVNYKTVYSRPPMSEIVKMMENLNVFQEFTSSRWQRCLLLDDD